MFIAKELKKTNISEYLIYMFQVEDMIRFNECDSGKVVENIVNSFSIPENQRIETKKWYEALCRMMNEEGIQESGHLKHISNQIKELTDYHYKLLELTDDNQYSALYNQSKNDIEIFRKKLPSKPESEIEVCLYALYSLMLMRLRKMSISAETHEAMTNFSTMMAYLTKKYHEFEKGEMEL